MIQSFLNWLKDSFSVPQEMSGDHGNVIVIDNKSSWTAKVEEAKNQGKVVVVDFTATWCGPCKVMAPIFAELSKKYTNLVFLKVDVDKVQEVTSQWDVQAMPTFLFIRDGKQLHKIVGANKVELERKCHEYAHSQTPVTA